MALRRACAFPQGLGLYAARDIEKHTMVIEYIGTIIRNEVANRKEKLYESQVSSRPPVPSGAWGQGWVCPWKPPLERPVFPPVTVCEAIPAPVSLASQATCRVLLQFRATGWGDRLPTRAGRS